MRKRYWSLLRLLGPLLPWRLRHAINLRWQCAHWGCPVEWAEAYGWRDGHRWHDGCPIHGKRT